MKKVLLATVAFVVVSTLSTVASAAGLDTSSPAFQKAMRSNVKARNQAIVNAAKARGQKRVCLWKFVNGKPERKDCYNLR